MSANFYNAAGKMIGVDVHDYWAWIPPDPVPIDSTAISIVDALFSKDCGDEKTRLAHVTSSGKPTLQGGFTSTKIFHYPEIAIAPIPGLPPHPLQVYQACVVYAYASSTALLRKATVSGGGKPLAVCMSGAFGVNMNCGDPVDTPTGVVYNPNTVMTEPSTGDFVSAWISLTVDGIVSVLVGKLIEFLVGPLLPEPLMKEIEDKIKEKVHEMVDEQKAKHLKAALVSMGVTHV